MARSRNIKPGFFSNETLAELPPLGRLLFIGLWTIADREGRLEDRPKRIKAQLLPYDDCDVEGLLTDLAGKRDDNGKPAFIMRYTVSSQKLVQLVNWHKHQNPHRNETPSTLPSLAEGVQPLAEDVRPLAEVIPYENGTRPADSLSSDSLSSTPPNPPKGGKRDLKRFIPPTKAEVEVYIREMAYSFSADAFIDHYEANGWKRGKTPISDWRAACRTWEHRRKEEATTAPKPTTAIRILP